MGGKGRGGGSRRFQRRGRLRDFRDVLWSFFMVLVGFRWVFGVSVFLERKGF